MIETLSQLFLRDLEKLKTEITSYKDEKSIWEISGDIKNSAGNLCLHLCGNLQHFIGAVLGNSGFVRNRDAEFSRIDVPILELVAEIQLTMKVVQKALAELKEDDLQKTYPINVLGYEMTTEFFLIHLTTHLNYHLGQINYHRRLIKTSE
ncbi:MAG: DinB family protein [Ignavibacteriaceae bacterium]|nr:DinB family protein [Ignavibacteriaceae bacterium]